LQVNDNQGCTYNESIFVSVPPDIIISQTHVDVSCFGGNDGSINVSVNGGVDPYNYNWSNSSNSEDLNALISGIYSLVVTDANNCSKPISIDILQPTAPLTLTDSISNVSCFSGNNGAIDLTPSGGNGGFQYLWSNSQVNQDIQNLTSGTYSVVVTDVKNCTANETYFVAQPAAPLTLNVSSTPAICFGDANGSASVAISGGTPGYSISWNNGGSTGSIVSLIAGSYTVTVLDTNLCLSSATIQVNQPNLLVVNADSTNVSCFGAATGSVTALVTGGILPYSYLWSNNANSVSVSNLIS
jgi:hypothetical protein